MPLGRLSGIAHPAGRMRTLMGASRLGQDPNASLAAILDRTEAVDSLARLLTEGIEKTLTKDGRLDTKDLAAFLLRELAGHQK